ncbi:YciC family protein [Pragia fontium]|uniref:UPF0259 membrane protein SAMN02745723_10867 n=2 Tax=Pragia fontium TaxID=82985 RepID=A0AAJ4WC09_9GAMM|nr:YciC family protein [Pragia fontium]GKX62603.1 UPF0259 membrane protein [Pragia fontium]SFD12031.1 Uncharacterised protein family (UPF0259) [Pragia fontium DSM 5563 = ATCC 49100]
MPITANSLFRDSVNFIRNQLSSFIMLALLASFISYMLFQALVPNTTELHKIITDAIGTSQVSRSELQSVINGMSREQQLSIVEAAMPLFGAMGLSFLLSNLLLIGGVVTLIMQVSQGHKTSALRSIGSSAASLPMLLLLLVISLPLIFFGFSLYLLPGIFFIFVLVMAPIILLESKQGLIHAISTSWSMAFSNVKIILPIVLFTLSVKFILFMLSVNVAASSPVAISLLVDAISYLVTAFMFVYLFRLYMQVKG